MKNSGKKDIPDDDLTRMVNRLAYLVKIGCKPYEVKDFPEILETDVSEIERRVQMIRSITNWDLVPLPLLRVSNQEPWIARRRIERMLNKFDGKKSPSEIICNALQCSDAEMMELVIRNPRIIGIRREPDLILKKIDVLIKYGARLNDIKSYSSVLLNIPLETIELRAEKLSQMGCSNPLPVTLVGLSEGFDEAAKKLKAKIDILPEKTIDKSEEVIQNIPAAMKRKLHRVKPKVDLLLSRGYTVEEIIKNSEILIASFTSIHSTLNFFKQYHMELVNLHICCRVYLEK